MYPSWERISEITLVWHTTMAYRMSFLHPLSTERREKRWKNGEGREKEEKKESSSLVNIDCIRAHWWISQDSSTSLSTVSGDSCARRGVCETVNYHPLNNGAVYEFKRHVAPARSLRSTEALGAATSLLNFPPSVARNERATRRVPEASRSSLN